MGVLLWVVMACLCMCVFFSSLRGQVGNRREKVARASGALWKLMDGGDGSDDDNEEVTPLHVVEKAGRQW